MLIALCIDRLFGWPDFLFRRFSHPVVGIGQLISFFERNFLILYKTKKDRINRPLKKHFTAYDFFTTDPEGTLVLAGIVTPFSTKTLSPIVTPSSITQLISIVQLAPI